MVTRPRAILNGGMTKTILAQAFPRAIRPHKFRNPPTRTRNCAKEDADGHEDDVMEGKVLEGTRSGTQLLHRAPGPSVRVDALRTSPPSPAQLMYSFAPGSVDAFVRSWPPPSTRTIGSEPQLMHLFAPGSSAPVDALNCSWPAASTRKMSSSATIRAV